MKNTDIEEVPGSAAFRAWVQKALAALGCSASSVARALGLSRNTLAAFLSDPERSITLDTAQKVSAHLRGLAADQGVTLDRIGGA